MKELLEKVTANTPEQMRTDEEVLRRLDLFLRNINDSWTNERLTVAMVNMKFNELMQQMVGKKSKKAEKAEGVGYVDFRPGR